MVGDPDATRQFYHRRHYRDHPPLRDDDAGMGGVVRLLLGRCLGVQDTEWDRVRKPFVHPFSAHGFARHGHAVRAAVSCWLDAKVGPRATRCCVDVGTLAGMSFDLFARVTYGHDLCPADLRELRDLLGLHEAAVADGRGLWGMLVLRLSPAGKALAFRDRWVAFNKGMMAHWRSGAMDARSVFAQVAAHRDENKTLSDDEFYPDAGRDPVYQRGNHLVRPGVGPVPGRRPSRGTGQAVR